MTATPRPATRQNQADHQGSSRQQSSTMHRRNIHPAISPWRCCSIRTPFGGSRHDSDESAPGLGARSGPCATRRLAPRTNSRRRNACTGSAHVVGAREHHYSPHEYRGDVRLTRPIQAASQGACMDAWHSWCPRFEPGSRHSVIVPVKRAIEHVQSPEAKNTWYGRFSTRLSGNVLNISIASAR
jgi:hypothetical protein